MNLTRRHALLGASAIIPILLAACGIITTKTTGGVNTVTINTKALNTDGSAIIAAAQAILGNPLVGVALGANLLIAETLIISARATMASIAAATNGSTSLSVDTTSVQNLVNSLIADVNQFVTLIGAALPLLGIALAATVKNYLTAIQTLSPLVQLAVALAIPASATLLPRMSEAQALAVATH